MTTRDYPADGITIGWDSERCIHSAECVKALPLVFRPREAPWVRPEHATADAIAAAIDRCPSGALTYTREGPTAMSEPTEAPDSAPTPAVDITVTENGWYQVNGPARILGADGSVIREGEKFFLCRCGHSKVKPFCDSSHKEFGFTDDGLGPRKG